MTYAAITGWGKCMPPAVLSNADLATFLETDDEWITSRTGMKERRVSHVHAIELSYVASMRALACAGLNATDIDLIVYGSCSFDEMVPNSASGLQYKLGAKNAASMDVNTACTSFLYSWTTANAMIRSGVVKRALVVGVELISRYMDWENRGVAVLFGDGCAAIVIEATEEKQGCWPKHSVASATRAVSYALAGTARHMPMRMSRLAICHGRLTARKFSRKPCRA